MTKTERMPATQRPTDARSETLASWTAEPARRDPVDILMEQGKDRIALLLPLRYARMQTDPFAFLRGAAAVMAEDLGHQPNSGLLVQSGGDCHLANFGSYASPEGTPVFDVNDFDETLPAPFEWDVKRLATSLALAGHVASYSKAACRHLARSAAHSYRRHLTALAAAGPFTAWNTRIDLVQAIKAVEDGKLRRKLAKRLDHIIESGKQHFDLARKTRKGWRLDGQNHLITRSASYEHQAFEAFDTYKATLPEERRVLVARYTLEDVALKVVGVGSVGTLCAVGLFVAENRWPLLLQIKEAQVSVLAQYGGAAPSAYTNQGERVVCGQRMMQAASDIFLGWAQTPVASKYFYVRQLKDSHLANLGDMIEESLPFYAQLCGQTLARAHARSGDLQAMAAYIGSGPSFDKAIAAFAMAYADQTERDWAAFRQAIAEGRLPVAKSDASP